MNASDYDFSDDDLPPRDVLEHLRAHDKRMRDGRDEWGLAKATYENDYWDYVLGAPDAAAKWLAYTRIEVNRLWPVVSSYLAALYPRANRVVLGPDPAGIGDPIKAQLAANKWIAATKVHRRVQTGLRQALLYPGCGAKIGYKPGTGTAIDRVWLRIMPWWEMMLDADVLDTDDERFRGHVYYRPVREIEREYDLHDIKGTDRVDFLSRSLIADQSQNRSMSGIGKKAMTDLSAFVRVLEFINLVDTVADPDNPRVHYQGRLEIYILDQGSGPYEKPVWMGPLPLAMPDGRAVPHVAPLIFNPSPEFPYRGIPSPKRLMPQIRELNAYRSYMAFATRKDTRQYMVPKDLFSGEDLTKLEQGIEGAILQIDTQSGKYDGALGTAIVPVPNTPLSGNIPAYLALVEKDLEQGIGQSPNVMGLITKATAQEVATAQQYTESDFGRHAERRDDWLAEVVTIAMRAIVAAMHDRGDSAGAFEREASVALGVATARPADSRAAPARPDGNAVPDHVAADDGAETKASAGAMDDEAQALGAAVADMTGGQTPMQDSGPGEDLDHVRQRGTRASVEQDVLSLRIRGDDVVPITVEDLDGDFVVSFVEGGRTPMTDAAMQQALLTLAEPYAQWWQRAQKGGPDGLLARRWMTTTAERFDFPKDLHPDELDAAGAAQASVAPAENGAEAGETANTLERALALPPAEAIQVLKTLFRDNPEVLQTLERLEALPSEEQPRVLESMFKGGSSAPPQGVA